MILVAAEGVGFERTSFLGQGLFSAKPSVRTSARAPRPDSQPIVNDLLKAIPAFKSRLGRLMIMATNSIVAIDLSMLRPGRFDLIIPVGARPGRARRAGRGDPARVRPMM